MLNLSLTIKPGNWQHFMARRHNQAFLRIAEKIYARDHHTCQYCGFQAESYMDVVNRDHNYRNNKASNLVTACGFCSQCFFLESVGMDEMSGGQLLYLPEMSQADLNSFCHVLFCALGNGTKHEDSAQIIYRTLKFRSQLVESAFGKGTSDPRLLGSLVVEHMATTDDDILDKVLDGLRLLPNHNKFQVQLESWASTALQELTQEVAAEGSVDG